MKINLEPVKEWFGYSRRERRSSIILLFIILIVFLLRYGVPEQNIEIKDLSAGYKDSEDEGAGSAEEITDAVADFNFDPNTASYDTLLQLGMAPKAANTLISYRNKGGRFRYPSDIKKVYGIDEVQAARLIPLVEVAADTSKIHLTGTNNKVRPLLDLNSCDSMSLVRLPGIGPVLSLRIIKYRNLIGGFARVEQLKEVYGLPVETYDLIASRLYADTLMIKRLNINLADYKEMARLPYLERYEVTAILKYRELKGRITGMTDLTENKLITIEKAGRVGPYLRFE